LLKEDGFSSFPSYIFLPLSFPSLPHLPFSNSPSLPACLLTCFLPSFLFRFCLGAGVALRKGFSL
jgi:hypothetical protein